VGTPSESRESKYGHIEKKVRLTCMFCIGAPDRIPGRSLLLDILPVNTRSRFNSTPFHSGIPSNQALKAPSNSIMACKKCEFGGSRGLRSLFVHFLFSAGSRCRPHFLLEVSAIRAFVSVPLGLAVIIISVPRVSASFNTLLSFPVHQLRFLVENLIYF
jgi:hypothetical protein